MFARIAVSTVVVALVAPVSAQQMAPAPSNQEAIKFQVSNFELLLRNAVLRAGKEVADKAHDIVPDVQLDYTSDVGVSSWWTPDFGYEFDVTVPGILPTVAGLFVLLQMAPPAVRPVAGNAVPNGRTGVMTVPRDDVMVKQPVVPFDPDKEYSDRTRQALVDAIVDNSGGLQLKDGEKLRVIASPEPLVVPNRLANDSRKLILTVKGEDLLLFRQNKLTREQLLDRIVERRF